MVEETKTESFTLPINRINWLNIQKRLTGKPKSYFVDQGLKIVMGEAHVSALKLIAIPLVYFYAGLLIILFSLIFYHYIPLVLVALMVSLGIFTEIIASYAVSQGFKLWRAQSGR